MVRVVEFGGIGVGGDNGAVSGAIDGARGVLREDWVGVGFVVWS